MANTSSASRTTATAISLLAGVWLLVVGLIQFAQGLAALLSDTSRLFVRTPNYLFDFNVTAWGWIHLVLGVLLFVVGLFVVRGSTWARLVAVTLAAIVMVVNFLWIPYYPLWAIVLIALNALVIWALMREEPHEAVA